MSDSETDILPTRKAKPAFAAGLMDSSDDDSGSGSEADAPVIAAKPAAKAEVKPAAADTKAPAAKGKAAKGKGKRGGKGGDDDDLDALLSELGGDAAPAPAAAAAPAPKKDDGKKAAAGGAGAADAAAAYLASLGLGDDEEAAGAKAGDKKKKKKGKKAAAGGAGAGGEGSDDEGEAPAAAAAGAAPAAAAAAPKKVEKLSAAARAAQERLAAVRAEQERKERVEAEKRRREEELKELEEAEERKRRERREREKEKERLRKEKEKAEGTYMTKKQKEALERARARLGVAVEPKSGGAAAGGAGEEAGAEEAASPDVVSPPTEGGKAGKVKTAALYAGGRKKAGDKPAAAAGEAAPAPAPAAPAPAAAAAEPSKPAALLAALAGAAAWEDAADDWETKAEVLVSGAPSAAATPSAGAAAPASTTSAASGPSGASSAAAAAAAGPVLYYPGGTRRIPTAGESAGKPLDDRIEDSRARRNARQALALEARSDAHLRSPICVVLGHVDTGKTSLLDRIRRTNVQEGEAGGITQQIGATYIPQDRLRMATDKLAATKEAVSDCRVPGLLIIDTPGHESFVNLRSRGAGLCDIAVLVIDVMHGLERQTIESIQLLKQKRTPFIVALNKIDRCYGWKPKPNAAVRESLASQEEYAVAEFKTRTEGVLTQLAEQGLNAKLYYENDDFRRNVSVVPTSAHTGEGIPDLLNLIVQLTQQMMGAKLMFADTVQASILEVKSIDGLGTTVDIVLVNGQIREGDTIVVCGMDGPIVTQVRALLTPPPLREMRVKSEYVHHKRIEAAMGIKIAAQHLDKAVAGTSLLVAHPDDEIEDLKEEVMEDFEAVMKGFKKDSVGVMVQASTLGSLEALLEYLRTHDPPVPVANVGIGPLHKKDIVSASIMLEHRKEYATILAFDVKVTPEARAAAEDLGVTIFTADIIYHLTDQFEAYMKRSLAAKQAATAADAVFPAVCRIIQQHVYNKRDPIVCGVDVLEGKLRIGTPLCVVLPEGSGVAAAAAGAGGEEVRVKSGPTVLTIGRVASIEHNHVALDVAPAGGPSVAVKIVPEDGHAPVTYGRQFDHTHLLYSRVSRTSINVLKENFRADMNKENWKTVIKLKELLGVD